MKNESDSPNNPPPQTYIAYLLRLWRSGDEPGGWRCSLERAQGGERLGFASLEPLFLYLLELTEDPGVHETGPPGEPGK
jgi:hypothetical protein